MTIEFAWIALWLAVLPAVVGFVNLRLLRALAPTLAAPRPWRTLAALERLP